MKKILFILLFTILLLPIKVLGAYQDTYIDWIDNTNVYAHQIVGDKETITHADLVTANGDIAYCIQPGIKIEKGTIYNSTNNVLDTPVPNINTKLVSLIGYYGYEYEGHQNKLYYMATQELIWKLVGLDNVWFTDGKYGNIYNLDLYKEEIMNMVKNYEVTPSFNFKDKYMVGDEVILNDNNNVLSGYEVIGNNNITINGNNIVINVTDDNNFTLRRKSNGYLPTFYYVASYQTVASFKYAYDVYKDYNVDSFYGKITVSKYDKDTNSKELSSLYADLSNAEYTLYDSNDNVIDVQLTDVDGELSFDNLIKGNYTVKETKPSNGYLIDNNVYKAFIGTNMRVNSIKSYEEIIKGTIIINKMYDDPDKGMCVPEGNILFGVYDVNDNKIDEQETDKDGIISFTLPYGKYVIKQLSSPENVSKVEDFYVDIDEDKEELNYVLVNKPILKELPQTGKSSNYLLIFISMGFIYYVYKKINI